MIEAVPDEQLVAHYTGSGRTYHPKLMLKVILYGYSRKIYSCRGIEKLLYENIPAMWLAATQQPDFRILNEFRGVRMKAFMDELFGTMIQWLIADHYITMAQRSKPVRASISLYGKKSTLCFEKKLKKKIQETLHHIHAITQQDVMGHQKPSAEDLSAPLEKPQPCLITRLKR